MLRNRAARPPELATTYWLVESSETVLPEPFTVRIDAEMEALPVFSFPEEAEMFVTLGGLEERGWRTAESTAGEILSRLAESRRAGIGLVALDPFPEMMGPMFDTTIALVTLSLDGFAARHAVAPFVAAPGPPFRLTCIVRPVAVGAPARAPCARIFGTGPQGRSGRGLAFGHGAVVEDRRQHAADDRAQNIEPRAREVARHEHRPERAHRVDGAAGYGPRYKDPDGQGEPHGYRGYGRGRPIVGGDSHDHEDEDEGYEYLEPERLEVADPLRRVGGRQLCLHPARPAESEPGAQGAEHGPDELRPQVEGHGLPRELARGGQPEGDGRVDVGPGDVPDGGGNRRERQAEGQGYRQRVVGGASRRAAQDGADRDRGTAEDQDKRAHELGQRGP